MHARVHYRLELAGKQIEIVSVKDTLYLNFETKKLHEKQTTFSKHCPVVDANCFRQRLRETGPFKEKRRYLSSPVTAPTVGICIWSLPSIFCFDYCCPHVRLSSLVPSDFVPWILFRFQVQSLGLNLYSAQYKI